VSAFSRKSAAEEPPRRSIRTCDLKHENLLLLELERALTRLALSKLTELQRTILLKLYCEGNGKHTLSSLVRKLAEELEVPESTLKWSIRGLRDLGLVESGSVEVKGVPVSLTYAGLVVAKNIVEGGGVEGPDSALAVPIRRCDC
jgi:DNA-binding MarR family transcriptional regulator